ncbi:MAG: DeoR family transcriptional regulator [Spirochaetota bacterium]
MKARSENLNQLPSKHRLKQKDLVMSIFYLFEEEYERSNFESIWDIKIPIESVKSYLKKKYQASYRSNLWVYTQLKRYEDELGVKLFRKESDDLKKGNFLLSINDKMIKFYQKQHLYVTQKIKVANGVYDKIKNDIAERKLNRPVKILLGAGSTIFHLANIIAERSWEDCQKYSIYTHNLGSLRRLLEPTVNYNNIEVFTPSGKIDPVTYTIIGRKNDLYLSTDFDYIVKGTSFVQDGKLYVESPEEGEQIGVILKQCRGEKILVLTKHEFTDHPLKGLVSYGNLRDCDYIVVPRFNAQSSIKKKSDEIFEQYQNMFSPEIIHWNYIILKVLKDQ